MNDTNDLNHWTASMDDLILHRWPHSSGKGRHSAIKMVERLMSGEILEMIEAEPAPIRKAGDEIASALELPTDEAMVRLVALIAKTLVEHRTLSKDKKSFFISGE